MIGGIFRRLRGSKKDPFTYQMGGDLRNFNNGLDAFKGFTQVLSFVFGPITGAIYGMINGYQACFNNKIFYRENPFKYVGIMFTSTVVGIFSGSVPLLGPFIMGASGSVLEQGVTKTMGNGSQRKLLSTYARDEMLWAAVPFIGPYIAGRIRNNAIYYSQEYGKTAGFRERMQKALSIWRFVKGLESMIQRVAGLDKAEKELTLTGGRSRHTRPTSPSRVGRATPAPVAAEKSRSEPKKSGRATRAWQRLRSAAQNPFRRKKTTESVAENQPMLSQPDQNPITNPVPRSRSNVIPEAEVQSAPPAGVVESQRPKRNIRQRAQDFLSDRARRGFFPNTRKRASNMKQKGRRFLDRVRGKREGGQSRNPGQQI